MYRHRGGRRPRNRQRAGRVDKVGVRMDYGFKNIDNLVSLLVLRCSDLQPVMPWEDRAEEERKAETRRERDRERSKRRRKERCASTG